MTGSYIGWKNRQTWNVMLWLNNDYDLYKAAVKFIKKYTGTAPYAAFIYHCDMQYDRTPDNIKWMGSRLDYKALNEAMKEFRKC